MSIYNRFNEYFKPDYRNWNDDIHSHYKHLPHYIAVGAQSDEEFSMSDTFELKYPFNFFQNNPVAHSYTVFEVRELDQDADFIYVHVFGDDEETDADLRGSINGIKIYRNTKYNNYFSFYEENGKLFCTFPYLWERNPEATRNTVVKYAIVYGSNKKEYNEEELFINSEKDKRR